MKKGLETLIIFVFVVFCFIACKDTKSGDALPVAKETYFPIEAWRVNPDNDYTNADSQFNIYRSATTDNLVAFWEPQFGDDPENCEDETYRFPLKEIMQEGDKMYTFFRDKLNFIEKDDSLTNKYRMMMYVFYNDDGTVYGGGIEDKVGAIWLSPNRVKYPPYGALAHELGHAFQYMVHANGKWGFSSSPEGSRGQTIWEMTSQYMLWQYYPEWLTFENYHLKAYLENTHKAFLHEDIQYSAPFVLEYWADIHDPGIVGKVWHEAVEGEDPVKTYKRITDIDQKIFNDQIFDASRKFVSWDLERIRETAKIYINQHTSKMNKTEDGWYLIDPDKCPQNYGYNAIRLEVPEPGAEVSVDFEGMPGADGFRNINSDKAGWRYGFVAYKNNGERVYGEMNSLPENSVLFKVPEGTEYLWFVVSGAPEEHWEHLADGDPANDEQWPYRIRLTGTGLHDSVVR